MFQLIKDFQEIKIKLKIIFIIFALLILEQFDYCAMAQTRLQPIISISSGGQVFLRADGSVWSFTDMRYLAGPIEILGLDDIVRVGFDNVSTGYALRRDGTVWSWEVTCRLPDESTETCIHTNSKRLQGLTEITDFSVGHGFLIALKNDGTVWGVGDNTVGELGNTVEQLHMSTYKKDELLKNNPKIVANAIQIPVLSNVIKISAGFYRSAAIDKTGQVWVWGFGTGDLGSSIDDQFVSKDGVGVTKQAHAPLATNVAAGSSLEFVVGKDGKIWKRGFYSDGVVRYGDYQFSEINEVDHPRVISANYGAIFGIGSDGQGWQWGSGIGYDLKSPQNFIKIGSDTELIDISAGYFFASALTADGKILTWGTAFGSQSNPTVVIAH